MWITLVAPQALPRPAAHREGLSPKPRGCPPMRTILHSSPEELVSRRSLGNLGHKWPWLDAQTSPPASLLAEV